MSVTTRVAKEHNTVQFRERLAEVGTECSTHEASYARAAIICLLPLANAPGPRNVMLTMQRCSSYLRNVPDREHRFRSRQP